MKEYVKCAELLKSKNNILILTHRRPDGDTTGSAGALVRALRDMGKTAYVLKNPEITPRYAVLIDDFLAPDDFIPEFVVSVDMADVQLFPENAKIYENKVDLCIDHHRSNSGYAAYSLIIPEFAACGELICRIIEALDVKITKEIAYSLYVAISTDTGCFRYSNTTSHTHKIASICLEAGVDGGEINRELFETKSRPRFEMERIIFDSMKFYHDGKIAVVLVLRKDCEQTGADMDDLDAISALPRQIEGVEIGITLQEQKTGNVKLSVRTTKEKNAAKICEIFGGGGHLRAAGAVLPFTIEECIKKVVAEAEATYA